MDLDPFLNSIAFNLLFLYGE
uniref:Uncharacterized protein n=1 Tax=Arundo donax TaxID=35708 RepID=A0A0A8YKB5_ARUDO